MPADPERDERSRCALAAGGLPLNAVERLQAQAIRQGTQAALFTSTLSGNELLLTRRYGFQALGQVMGSTVYQVGVDWRSYNWRDSDRWKPISFELKTATEAFHQARTLTLGRLAQEAKLLGATGVVGVRLEFRKLELGQGGEHAKSRGKPDPAGVLTGTLTGNDVLEFVAVGTAVREADRPAPARPEPWLSAVSGQEFALLAEAGYRPVGLVIGNCSYYQMPSRETLQATQTWWGRALRNLELEDFTQGVYGARSLAMERMEAEARALRADGVVGVRVEVEAHPFHREETNSPFGGMTYHFTAVGTAIVRTPGDVDPDVQLAVSLG